MPPKYAQRPNLLQNIARRRARRRTLLQQNRRNLLQENQNLYRRLQQLEAIVENNQNRPNRRSQSHQIAQNYEDSFYKFYFYHSQMNKKIDQIKYLSKKCAQIHQKMIERLNSSPFSFMEEQDRPLILPIQYRRASSNRQNRSQVHQININHQQDLGLVQRLPEAPLPVIRRVSSRDRELQNGQNNHRQNGVPPVIRRVSSRDRELQNGQNNHRQNDALQIAYQGQIQPLAQYRRRSNQIIPVGNSEPQDSSSSQQMSRIQEQQDEQLSCEKYLRLIFSQWQIPRKYKRITRQIARIGFSPNAYFLFHLCKPVIIDQFVKYKWTPLEDINFCSSEFSSDDWKVFVQYKHLYPKLKRILISKNKIQDISVTDLQSFPQLKHINLKENPLTQQSKQQIQKYKLSHPNVILKYREND